MLKSQSTGKKALKKTKKTKQQPKKKTLLSTSQQKRQFSAKSEASSAYPEKEAALDRVKGEFSTFYRHAVITKVLDDMTSNGGPITFFNITGGNVAHQLKESHVHKDATYLYKWLRLPIGLRSIPEGIDSLKPYLKQFAYANEDVPMDAFGFPKDLYLPGVDFIANRILRPQDKHIIFENRQEQVDLLQLAFGNDERVTINQTGLYKEADLKSLLPCHGRAVVHVDIHESTTFEQQKRSRNALFGFLKRMPHATFVITYPLVEDNHPFEFLDAFARTGMQTGYGTSQFADQMAAERNLVTSILEESIPSTEYATQMHASGRKGRVFFNTWTPRNPSDSTQLPSSIGQFRPRSYWNGAGALVFNAGHNYSHTLQAIGDSLRIATGKPSGLRYGLSGPLFEPLSYEVGQSWGHKMSFSTPGIALPEDYSTMTTDEIRENVDRRLIDELMDKIDYLPMKGGPTNLYELGKEQIRLSNQGKRLLEPSQLLYKSNKEHAKTTPLEVYNKLTAYARNQDLKYYKTAIRAQMKEDMGQEYDQYRYRYSANGIENAHGFLQPHEKLAPTRHELQHSEFFEKHQ